MSKYLLDLGNDFLMISHNLPAPLNDLIENDFDEVNGSVFLKGHQSVVPIMSNCEKSNFEDNENHFHPEDFVEEDIKEIEYLKLALECGKRICRKLQQSYLSRRFRIIISFEFSNTENCEIITYGSSSVRFYEVRDECEHKMYVKDFEKFKEAIMEIETC